MFGRIIFSAAVTASLLAAMSTAPLLAADNLTPVKAPAYVAANPCAVATASTPLSCSGLYVGAGLAGQGSNADIVGSGINGSVFAGGMVPSVNAGYQYVQGNWLFGAELDLGYAVGSNVAVNGVGGSVNGLRISEFFKVGGNLAGLLGTSAPITIPPQLANSVLGVYGGVGSAQWWFANAVASGTSSGAGVLFDISPKWFGDLRYTYTNFNGAKAGGITVQNDQSLRISINYKLN